MLPPVTVNNRHGFQWPAGVNRARCWWHFSVPMRPRLKNTNYRKRGRNYRQLCLQQKARHGRFGCRAPSSFLWNRYRFQAGRSNLSKTRHRAVAQLSREEIELKYRGPAETNSISRVGTICSRFIKQACPYYLEPNKYLNRKKEPVLRVAFLLSGQIKTLAVTGIIVHDSL